MSGNSNTTCFLFFTWHKSCSCGPMWQFCRGWDLRLQLEDGGDGDPGGGGAGWDLGGHHHRQGVRGAQNIRWWLPSFNSNNGDCQAFPTPDSLPSFATPSWRSHRSCFKRMESQTVLNKLCRVVTRLIAKFLSFLFKIKTTQFLPVSIKNPLKTTMKTITFKTRLIGKALFSFNPATQELWGRQNKNARLDRGEYAGSPDLC